MKIKTSEFEAALRSDLSSFIQKSFRTVNPGTAYLHNWHIDLIAEYLTACNSGEIKRLIINMPPRYMKSLCVSVAWPAWLIGNDPSRRIIAASYSHALALKHSTDCRLLIKSRWYKKIFPWVEFASDQDEKGKFVTTQRGMRLATSVGGTLTGEGGNFLIVDDPHNPTDIHSEKTREHTLEWFGRTFASRLDDKKNGVIVVVMQRLHQNDLTGYLLDNNRAGWMHLSLPVEAEERATFNFGAFKKIMEAGEILHQERESKEQLERARKELGSYVFAAQYQQSPVPAEGGMIKPAWVKKYKSNPNDIKRITQSWDTAIKSGQNNDYSVCTTWAEAEGFYYLMDVTRLKAEYPELKKAIINLADKWQADGILLEDKASGQSLIQDLRRETKLALIAILPEKDKLTRMAAASSMIESGRVILPENAIWLADYEKELFSFPSSPHDDQVDSTSQFLNWISKNTQKKPGIRKL